MNRCPYTNVIAKNKRFKEWADLVHARFDALETVQIFKNLTDIVPEILLPWQADEKSLTGFDGWSLAISDLQKRELIKSAIELHSYKGTPWSIEEIMRRLGYGEIEIDTNLNSKSYDGEIDHNGIHFYGEKGKWALYRVTVFIPLMNTEARFIRNVLRYFAPAHCTLYSLDYTKAALFYDGTAKFDGIYNFGEA